MTINEKIKLLSDTLTDDYINQLGTTKGIFATDDEIITIDMLDNNQYVSSLTLVKVIYGKCTHAYTIRDNTPTYKNDIRRCIIDGVKRHLEYIEKHTLTYSKIKRELNSLYGYYTDTDNAKPCIIQINRYNKLFEYDCLKVYSNGYTELKNDVAKETACLIYNDYVCSNHSFDEKNDIDTYVYVPRGTGETR